MIDTMGYYLFGATCSILYILFIRRISKNETQEFVNYAIGLIITALIYIGFAVWHQESEWYSLELTGLLIYGSLALFGIRYSVWFIAIGWATHVCWDVVLHMDNAVQFVPIWYPPVCLIFDLILAFYIAYRFMQTNESKAKLSS